MHNIAVKQTQGSANTAQAKGTGLSKDDLYAFLNLLAARTGNTQASDGSSDLAAKVTQLLKDNPADKAALVKILQKLQPGTNDDVLKQLSSMLQKAVGVKPSLTSDLTAKMSVTLQGDSADNNNDLMQKLQDKFANLQSLTPEALAKFRQDAIKLMKDMGMDDGDIDQTLVKLTMSLGAQVTDAQATQLMMPLPPSMPQQVMPASADSNSATGTKQASAPMTPQELASQQLDTAAKDSGIAKPQMKGTPAPADSSQQPQAQQAGALPQQDAAPAPRPQLATAAHLSFINSFASGDDGSDSDTNGFGQPSSQGGDTLAGTLSNLMQASEASPESFVNYLTSTSQGPATQTTQMVAMQIQSNAQSQTNTFTMELQPAELGRLEIRLKFDKDGGIKAHLIADKADTFSMLQKDSPQLHRILQQAGLDVDDCALSFDLRQQNQQNNNANDTPDNRISSYGSDDDTISSNALQAKIAVEAMGHISSGGVNIMV